LLIGFSSILAFSNLTEIYGPQATYWSPVSFLPDFVKNRYFGQRRKKIFAGHFGMYSMYIPPVCLCLVTNLSPLVLYLPLFVCLHIF
jgi:hypothetical protein